MKLSTKGRYAVTAIMDLVLHEGDGPVALADISQSQQISLSYLEQLFARLRRAGLVSGVRGPGGGYRLARPAAEISVAAVIEAVDESLDATRCKGRENCQGGNRCLTHDLWSELSCQIQNFLAGISLADMAQRPGVVAVVARQDSERDRGRQRRLDA
ncbi:Rrf2 family iron-sulfur cluster assembly transcriptional regulator [Natronocella acetinitrilica]|uniref:Rrf2 family iron-sulfur cluster assembly transcriptional regulator n=1 Tax=Natronocella acetinitrilica TaxID=414046 RepID=A0AAE3KBY0_9GAMM|nr:Rrf2 family transcriptional regulator [Natronocella acetinitrilica]MCP1676235.1 Rrf2 family iron-sulfur cluster assembly transcriptional regulator [Natronocella acetinitrilica]